MTERPTNLMLLVALLVALNPARAWSYVFCVTDDISNPSDNLQYMLEEAEITGADDEIRIEVGTFTLPEGGFYGNGDGFFYNSAWSQYEQSLEISGGWMTFLGTPCAMQWKNPQATILDGSNSARVLKVRNGENDNLTVRNLTLMNGDATGTTDGNGGGLKIEPNSGYNGNVVIENVAFVSNHAQNAGGLVVDAVYAQGSSGKITVRNNLFAGNSSTMDRGGASLSVDMPGTSAPTNNPRILFINNTVVNNTFQSLSGTVGGVGMDVDAYIELLIVNNNLWGNKSATLHVSHPFGNNYRLWNNNIDSRTGHEPGSASNNISVVPEYESCWIICIDRVPTTGSPLVDGGFRPGLFASWSLSQTDMRGKPRINGKSVDIGAYESQWHLFNDRFQQ